MKKIFKSVLLSLMFVAGVCSFVACNNKDGDNGKKPPKTYSSVFFSYSEGVDMLTLNENDIKNTLVKTGFSLSDQDEDSDGEQTFTYLIKDKDGNYHVAEYSTFNNKIIYFSYGVVSDSEETVRGVFSTILQQSDNFMKDRKFKVFSSLLYDHGHIIDAKDRYTEYDSIDKFRTAVDITSLDNIRFIEWSYEAQTPEFKSLTVTDNFESEVFLINIEKNSEDGVMGIDKKYASAFSVEFSVEDNDYTVRKRPFKINIAALK